MRIDVIPEDQKGAKCLKVAFSATTRMPQSACFLTPFLLSVHPDESFDLTICRIMSLVADLVDPTFILYREDCDYERYHVMNEDDCLYDYLTPKSELFIVLSRKTLLQIYAAQQNRDVKILN